jgi:DNA helicase HerA-like ATPase
VKIIEKVGTLTIGTVESVSPSQIKVLLELDAPQATALNTGYPTRFPRINGYVLIPNETGAVVGLIDWLGVERSSFPKRTGLKDFGLIDLPYPLRKLSLTPVGTLRSKKSASGYEYSLERGVSAFPSVGDPVLLPTNEQLRSIIESKGSNRRVKIGVSPLADNAEVTVDPDKMFGRHLAVLGNTGSGKSCTLAGLIRWSIESAERERQNLKKEGPANARFIILDPNGEYLQTFADLPSGVRIFKVLREDRSDQQLEGNIKSISLPAWMWNSQEWAAFSSARPGVQRPLLLQGLRDLRSGQELASHNHYDVRLLSLLKSYLIAVLQVIHNTAFGNNSYQELLKCAHILVNLKEDINYYLDKDIDSSLLPLLQGLSRTIDSITEARKWRNPSTGKEGYNPFSQTDFSMVEEALNDVISAASEFANSQSPRNINEDSPIPFEIKDLSEHLEHLASNSDFGNNAQFVATLTMRIRNMLADRRLGPILNPSTQPSFEQWLNDYIGMNDASNGQIAVLDLSLVPTEVIHMVVSVIGRLVFEATQRYRKIHDEVLPTVLVLEEAHTFIHRNFSEEEGVFNSSYMCRHTFERIAREGRKFGLGLVISSQRPSELSPTVLSQCNTFLLHRLVNDKDQELVSKLVPDNLGSLLKELPSLPARQAILLGWATSVPVLVEISKLPEQHCPMSFDPEFWKVWTGEKARQINWQPIIEDWQTL